MKSNEFSAAKIKLEQYIAERGMRSIPKRLVILEEICAYEGHFTVDSFYTFLKNKGIKVSRATIYNTVNLFWQIGLVMQHQIVDGRTLYESAGKKKHSHYVCTECGKIKEFTDDVLKTAIQTKRLTKFKQTNFSLCIYGVCSECQKKEKTNINKIDK